jgi:hypothetical protein
MHPITARFLASTSIETSQEPWHPRGDDSTWNAEHGAHPRRQQYRVERIETLDETAQFLFCGEHIKQLAVSEVGCWLRHLKSSVEQSGWRVSPAWEVLRPFVTGLAPAMAFRRCWRAWRGLRPCLRKPQTGRPPRLSGNVTFPKNALSEKRHS